MADIVVYGGSFAAAAAASKAAANAPNKMVAVIIPDPVSDTGSSFGSIGTVGGQNCFDIRSWKNGGVTDNPVKATFSWWISRWGQFYSVDQMEAQLKSQVTKNSKDTVYYG
ncbi:MAG: FAD-dependent oxidoreductase, partial [Oscillospiraceae bacterium]